MTVLTVHILFVRAIEWSAENQLTTDSNQDNGPAIMQAGDETIWVVWASNRNGSLNYELFYTTSSNYGLNWSNDTRLTEDPFYNESHDTNPSIMQASNGTIWVAWASKRFGNYKLLYKTFNGSSWSSDIQLPTNATESDEDMDPSIMQASNGTIWVVWFSNRTGNLDLFYMTYNGSAWSTENQLTNHQSVDKHPSIMQASNGTIWVVWSSFRTGDYELFYKTFNGTAWSSYTQLTYDSAFDEAPSIAQARDGTIWVVWQYFDGQADVYYKIYDGLTWSSEMPLISTTQAHNRAPSIAQINDRKIWVVWSTARDDDFDIYYKTTVVIPGDVNGDGTVDITDLTLIGEAYGTVEGDPDYNPSADLNCDDIIDIYDLEECGKNYG